MRGPAGRGTLRGNVAESSSSVPLENKLPARPLPSWALHQGHAAPGSWECAGEREQSHFPPRFFSLFRQKTVVEQIFSSFFFFSSLAWPNPNLLKILMETDVSLWLILFPSLQEGSGGQVGVPPSFLGGEHRAPCCPSAASATPRDAGGMSCPCSHTHTNWIRLLPCHSCKRLCC